MNVLNDLRKWFNLRNLYVLLLGYFFFIPILNTNSYTNTISIVGVFGCACLIYLDNIWRKLKGGE